MSTLALSLKEHLLLFTALHQVLLDPYNSSAHLSLTCVLSALLDGQLPSPTLSVGEWSLMGAELSWHLQYPGGQARAIITTCHLPLPCSNHGAGLQVPWDPSLSLPSL